MSIIEEQLRINTFDKFFADHIEELRSNYTVNDIDPMKDFLDIIVANNVEVDTDVFYSVEQELMNVLNHVDRANTFAWESGDDIDYDMLEYMIEIDNGHIHDYFQHIYFDDENEIFISYMKGNSYIHIEVGDADYIKNYVIELR